MEMLGKTLSIIWHAMLYALSNGYVQNILASLTFILFLWFLSKKWVPHGAPLRSVRERIASVLGLQMDPRDALWATLNDKRREKQYITWNLEDLKNGYLYSFPPPGRAQRLPPLIPIDPCRASGKELVFLAGESKSFKTKTAKAIAEALDERNLDILKARITLADLVHIREFYSHEDPAKLVRDLAAHAREELDVPGDLLLIVDVMTDWPRDEIVELVARILRNRHLYRRDDVTVLLILPDVRSEAESTPAADERLAWLTSLCRIYESARESQKDADKSVWDHWQVQYFRTVHMGADTVIERLAEKMLEDLTADSLFWLVKPLGRGARRFAWYLALQQTLRDLAAMECAKDPSLARGLSPDADEEFYAHVPSTILYKHQENRRPTGHVVVDRSDRSPGTQMTAVDSHARQSALATHCSAVRPLLGGYCRRIRRLYQLRQLWRKAHEVVRRDGIAPPREAVHSYLRALEQVA
jgi:hypothetical protein